MHNKLVKLFKGALIKQELNALACRHLSGFVLLFHTSGAAALLCVHTSLAQDLKFGF
jgi:hypothetical protein